VEPLAVGDPRQVGAYRLRARLGAGGMGQVLRGYSPAGRAVAVKVIHRELARDPAFRTRFRREVAAARAVSGAYTAPVTAAGPMTTRHGWRPCSSRGRRWLRRSPRRGHYRRSRCGGRRRAGQRRMGTQPREPAAAPGRRHPSVASAIVVTGAAVYAGSNDYTVHALRAGDGSQLWNFTTTGPVESHIAVAGELPTSAATTARYTR
jgi:hypothetical protein